jgi:hypothetical protein
VCLCVCVFVCRAASQIRRKNSWPFLEPVDPVALNIPDYLEVVTTPMDLTTVKVSIRCRDSHSLHEFNTSQCAVEMS